MVQRPSGGHGRPVRRLSRGASPSRSSQPLPLPAHDPAVHAKAHSGELAGLRAVRGDEDRPSRQSGYVGQDVGLSLSVECARDLVEHHNGRAGAHGARDGQALELPLGEPLPVLADHRVEPLRELLRKIPRARRLARAPDLVVICVGSRKRHVLAHRPRKQEVVLRHIRERPRRHLRRGARRALLKLVRKAIGAVGAQRQPEDPSTRSSAA